jgi:endo-1,4-beta-xylanase
MITELDLSVLPSKYWGADVSLEQAKEEGLDPYPDQLPPEVAQQHAEAAAELFRIFWRHRDKIDRVTFWNLHDGVSWKNNFPIPGRIDYPLLFDRELQPKPAFHRVLAVPGEASASPAEPR